MMTGLLKNTGLTLIAFTAIFFTDASVADEWPQFDCEDCRDISEHPEDARNFALNLIFGRNSSLSFDDTRFHLSDSFGNTIIVDINAKFIFDPYDYRLLDELFVEDLIIQILLMFPNGDLLTYKYPRSLLDPDGVLPVPAETPVTPNSGSSSGGPSGSPGMPSDGGEEDAWDERDENWADWEEAWGGWVCRPDFSHPNITGVICNLP
ncbi:MAG: hypothetical protein QNJ19_15195 [Woeseiaceae bacterium]|nr:hypothetical protein [Woeseiaceae bacterium]